MIDAVTVCVNYADFLVHTITNKECFDRWMIVTVEQDEETIQVCQDNNLEYCFSDRLLSDGGFHKGKAINDALMQMDCKDWVCLVDADTVLFPEAFKHCIENTEIHPDFLLGLYGRYQIDTVAELEAFTLHTNITKEDLDEAGMMVGYFQMWHSSRRPFYSEQWHHAGGDDILMRDSFHEDYWKILPTFALHLGPRFRNHKGRKTARFI